MIKLKHEGFDCEVKHISQFKPDTNHRWLILCLLDGEVDRIFTSDSNLDKAKADITTYYSFMFGEIDYSCVAYVKK